MIKSIFIAFAKDKAYAIPTKVGAMVRSTVRFDGHLVALQGKILKVVKEDDGTLVIIQNDGFGDNTHACSGWHLIPIWIGKYGQSGVLTTWSKYNCRIDPPEVMRAVDPALTKMLADLKDTILHSPTGWAA